MRLLKPKRLLSLLGVAATLTSAFAIEKDGKWSPPPLESMKIQQTNNGVTVAAMLYKTEELSKPVFRVNAYEHGILPVLLVIKNGSDKAVRIANLRVEYVDSRRNKVEATPASEVKYAQGPKRPNYGPGPIPGIRIKKKGALDKEEFEVRGFAAKMLPPGESAHGFLYFQTPHQSGDRLYITGLEEASTNTELFYFDLVLD